MATWYVNSAAAGTGAGTSWTNACTTLAAAITLSAAGDDFNVLSTHSESQASALTLSFKGTNASPNRIFSCGNTNSPATASDLLAGATVTTTGANAISFNGSFYCYGVTFNNGTGTVAVTVVVGNTAGEQIFDTCTIAVKVTTATCTIQFGGSIVQNYFTLINTKLNFDSGVSSSVVIGVGCFRWKNTSSAVGGSQTNLSSLFTALGTARAAIMILDGIDLTGVASGKNIVAAMTFPVAAQIINCRITSGALFATPTVTGASVDAVITDSGATGYIQSRYTYQGTLTTSTTVYNNATDGVTPISWQVVTTANAKRQSPFECFDIVQWVAAGTYAASTIQVTSATASLLNSDIWVETQYLGNASFPIASGVSSGPATQLTTGSSLAAGTWAAGGLGNNYKLAIPSFTTALAGFVRFRVKVAKASLTINIDPAVTVA